MASIVFLGCRRPVLRERQRSTSGATSSWPTALPSQQVSQIERKLATSVTLAETRPVIPIVAPTSELHIAARIVNLKTLLGRSKTCIPPVYFSTRYLPSAPSSVQPIAMMIEDNKLPVIVKGTRND